MLQLVPAVAVHEAECLGVLVRNDILHLVGILSELHPEVPYRNDCMKVEDEQANIEKAQECRALVGAPV
jgi:hypothetical protein